MAHAEDEDALDVLTSIVEAGDRGGVVRVAVGLTEAQRHALASPLRSLHARVDREHLDAILSRGSASRAQNARLVAADAARALTAPGSASGEVIRRSVDLDLLALRPPAWRQAWAGSLTADRACGLVYEAVRAGLVDRPEGPDWVLGLLGSLRVQATLANLLADDPVMLERDVWELFKAEGGGENSLAAHDKYSPPDRTWAHALQVLEQRGLLDRARLLDASLRSLGRDLPQFQAGWFSAFHEQLAPTVDERASRQGSYARLLGSPIAPTVAFALRALQSLQSVGRLDDDVLQAHLAPALLARAKTTATRALVLLEGCASPDPQLARIATAHPAADVQARAARLLARLGIRVDDAGFAPRLKTAPADDDGDVPELPERREVDPFAPRDLQPLQPVRDADDLAQRLVALAERLDDPDEMDLVVAAAVRLGPTPEVRAALAPLVPAAKRRLENVDEDSRVTVVVRALIVLLADPESPEPTQVQATTLPWADALVRVASGGAPPLHTPTHVGGWLDVDELARRLGTHGQREPAEIVAALERVPPWQGDGLSALAGTDHPVVAGPLARLLSGRPTEYSVRRTEHGGVRVEGFDVRYVDRWPYEDVAVRRDAHCRPGRKEGHYAGGVGALASNRDWWEARWHDRLFLEPLLDPHEPAGPMARLLVATALGTKDPAQRRLAVDVVVQAVDDGRLDSEALADGLVRASGWTALARLAGTLEEVASAGALQALVARRAALVSLPAYEPGARGLAALLEVLLDLSAAAGAAVEGPSRAWLSRLSGSSKAAKAARSLLAVQGRGSAQQRAAVAQARAGRGLTFR